MNDAKSATAKEPPQSVHLIQSHLPGPWSIIHRSIGPASSPHIAHVIGLIRISLSFIFITYGRQLGNGVGCTARLPSN